MFTRLHGTSRPRWARPSTIAVALILALAAPVIPQAFADDDGHHDNGNHYGQQRHQQNEHNRNRNWQQPQRYYHEPPVVYAPPPVYYGQPPGASMNFLFPVASTRSVRFR